MPRLLALAVVVAALAAAAVDAGSPAAAPGAAPRCTSSALVVWLDTAGEGAAGSTYYRLRLTNLSGRRCALRGYPGVSAIDLRGRQLGGAAARDAATAPRTVTLAPRATATATLRIVDVASFDRAACRPTTAAGLRVYPPGATTAKAVPFAFRACSRRGPSFLAVRAVAA